MQLTMATRGRICFNRFCIVLLMLTISVVYAGADEDRQTYIVYMGSLPDQKQQYSPSSHHFNLLQQVTGSSSAENLLIRSYKRSFNGFVAKLSEKEVAELRGRKDIVSIFPNRILKPQTTRSWDFIGLNAGVSQNTSLASDVIVGVIDTGIWPESESVRDDGFGPPPNKWKGACNGGQNFTCNNKLIGARYYTGGSARDDMLGHGTHTASTVAGNELKDAGFFGLASGTARGGVPSARIAIYKVCDGLFCNTDALLAAFDDAIADGVDILTTSLGGNYAADFLEDTIAIGAFHAMKKGIFTSQSAGNVGSVRGNVSSVAPWVISVAASTTDRLFTTKLVLGNGQTFIGSSINTFDLNGKMYPLTTDIQSVNEKIFVHDHYGRAALTTAYENGAVGAVIIDTVKPFNEPTIYRYISIVSVTIEDFHQVNSYINSTSNPTGSISKSEASNDPTAPTVASFSSRGPNAIALDILKPDVTAPGVAILASYPPNLTLFPPASPLYPDDNRRSKFMIMSGTSMACPHVAAVAAYVKSIHSDWSPSAIQSAIMTTAWPLITGNSPDAEFGYGSGHVNPLGAIDPGLVYEASQQDYIIFLCSLGYNASSISAISGDNSSCPESFQKSSPKDVNYPSLSAKVEVNSPFTLNFNRTVTNVGPANSTYTLEVTGINPELKIQVVPDILSFKTEKEKQSFNVNVNGEGIPDGQMLSAGLVWFDGKHAVRSPIVVHTVRSNTKW